MSEGKTTYQLPPQLTDQDTIGIIAPASAADKESTEAGINYLKSQGYNIKTAPNLNRELNYLAGDDKERIKHLTDFLNDDQISGIICVRGGYGMMRLLDKLDFDVLSQISPKVIMGYSDITVLQFAFLKKLNWITFSGPMVASDMGDDFSSYSANWMWKVIKEQPNQVKLENPRDKEIKVYRHGEAEGTLLPGCLSLITCLLDTEYCPSFKNSILVIEDIGETGYKLDRLLTTLKLHGVFNEISGLILGSFKSTDSELDEKAFPLNKLLDDIIGEYNFPVISGFAYGHIDKRLTLPVGIQAVFQTKPAQLTLNFI